MNEPTSVEQKPDIEGDVEMGKADQSLKSVSNLQCPNGRYTGSIIEAGSKQIRHGKGVLTYKSGTHTSSQFANSLGDYCTL